jgi:sulfide:quinone oxidoreductase
MNPNTSIAAPETESESTLSDTPPGRSQKHKVVIVGGGNAGISVAARLARAGTEDVAIIEPSETHYYQPLWTLVGGGVVDKSRSARPQASVIPKGVKWIKDRAAELDPENNRVVLESGDEVTYDFLVVACGIELDWDAVKGLAGAVGKNDVCSNYSYDTVDYTWKTIENFKGGTALFTMPPPPIKCAGAPQKIAYLADDAFRKNGVRDKSEVIYAAGTPGIFAVPEYAKTLNGVIARKGIDARFQHVLTELRPEAHEAVFEDRANDNAEVVIKYDMIHVTPPQRAPRVVRESPLADDAGWLSVDKRTLRSDKYENVFAIGDASSLPTSKTGAAIRKQAPVMVANLLAAIDKRGPSADYDGYTACPLVTGYGKLVMAEFDYELNLAPTFPIDQTKERWSMYQVKKRVLPKLYWDRILTGKA